MSEKIEQTEMSGQGVLIVLIHAYGNNSTSLRFLREAVEKTWPKAIIHCPDLPLGVFSLHRPELVAQGLVEDIDKLWQEEQTRIGNGFSKIVLVGHSIGALVARKIYVLAHGEKDVPFERGLTVNPRDWASKIDRIILFAAINRGWHLSHHLNPFRYPVLLAGITLAKLVRLLTGHEVVIMQVHRGSPFITNLRLQWLALRRWKKRQGLQPIEALTVQLLGTVDDVVPPDDNLDLVTGKNFVYRTMPFSGHADVVKLDNTSRGKDRKDLFVQALTGSERKLKHNSEEPESVESEVENDEVKDVVFVIHGIRDEAYWTRKIARIIERTARKSGRVLESQTSTYGYFPMLPFLLPWTRQKNVAWLMDRYTEAKAAYPDAEISYVGHSNGTYLLAKALSDYPACSFKHVVLAGSVIPSTFPWKGYLTAPIPRVRAILNYVATADWVVAYFPKAMEILRLQDIGSGGFDGFAALGGGNQVQYIRGGHGAALTRTIGKV
jgi:pimeloyl-ACP methyl ester carboxylesterase